MADIGSNIRLLRSRIPENVRIVAVSKTKTTDEIMAAYVAGHRVFGENRVQELLSKQQELPPDIEWHFVGHLQTNKVKQIVGKVHLIHSVDSFRLLEVIDRESGKTGCITDCLLQFHIAREQTKFGFTPEEAETMLDSDRFPLLNNVRITGVMGMATFTGDTDILRREFRHLKDCFSGLKQRFFAGKEHFREISMGMSGDYPAAIEEGATIIRIGTLIFGDRNVN